MIVYLVSNYSFSSEGERKFVGTLAEAKAVKAGYRASHLVNYLEDLDYGIKTFDVKIEKINYDTDKFSILSILNYEGGYSETIKEIV
jgi:hypothetical protein